MKIVLLGPPGAGKGSLAKAVEGELHISHISSGDLLRDEMQRDSELGREAKGYVEGGQLVPDQLITRLVKHRFLSDPCMENGCMLDGFPRTEKQAEDLDEILEEQNKSLDFVVYMESSLPIIIKRLCGRRVCRDCGALFHMTSKVPKKEGFCDDCGGVIYQRSDDNEETIKNRMEVYLKITKPIVDYYDAQGKVKRLNGDLETVELKNLLTQLLNDDSKKN